MPKVWNELESRLSMSPWLGFTVHIYQTCLVFPSSADFSIALDLILHRCCRWGYDYLSKLACESMTKICLDEHKIIGQIIISLIVQYGNTLGHASKLHCKIIWMEGSKHGGTQGWQDRA